MPLNICSGSHDPRARDLSNFTPFPFILDGITLASVEGFIQGIKRPVGDPMRELAFCSFGKEAKRLGRHAERKFVWWKDKKIVYGSREHHYLIERAIRAKFEQNPNAMKSLLATEGMILTHDLGYTESPHTSLPERVFCGILTRIRQEKLKERRN
ncbi:MAG: hypothetical protein Q8Q39_04840 [bacterium]|nr:hypothetical protein [bacterium]